MKNNFCCLPWNGLTIYTGGRHAPCYKIFPKQHGNAFKESLKNVYNQEYYTKLRKQFLENKRPNICKACWVEEDAGVESLRQHALKDYESALKNHDVNNPVPRILDVTLSNFCNAECISCNASSSHKWEKAEQELISLENNIFDRPITEKNPNEIKWNIDDWANIRHIRFGNNESMLDPNFRNFITMLSEHGKIEEISLEIITNSSYIPKQYILDAMKKFKKVQITISLDGVDDQAEYIRYPLKWNRVTKVVYFWNEFAMKNTNITLCCNTVVSIFNVFDMQPVIDFWADATRTTNSTHKFNFARKPIYLNPQILPNYIKEEVLKCNSIDRINKLLQVKIENSDQEIEKFFKFIAIMDKKRNLDYTKIFPKLSNLLMQKKTND